LDDCNSEDDEDQYELPEVEDQDESVQSITVQNENIVDNTDVFSAGSYLFTFL